MSSGDITSPQLDLDNLQTSTRHDSKLQHTLLFFLAYFQSSQQQYSYSIYYLFSFATTKLISIHYQVKPNQCTVCFKTSYLVPREMIMKTQTALCAHTGTPLWRKEGRQGRMTAHGCLMLSIRCGIPTETKRSERPFPDNRYLQISFSFYQQLKTL